MELKAVDDVSFAIKPGETLGLAVSYTHLDVYKRQGQIHVRKRKSF